MKSESLKPSKSPTSANRLLEEIGALLQQAESIVEHTAEAGSGPSREELSAIVKRVKSTTEQLRLSLRPGQLQPEHQATFGVAFASGSVSADDLRTLRSAALGWVFGAGLLLGMLLRRR